MNTSKQPYTAQEQQALDIFNRHVAAFTSGNLDAVMNDFGTQSLVITSDGVYEGLEQIRASTAACSRNSETSPAATRPV